MAEKRMFAKTIIDSDAFIDMPMSARLLYYDLAMRADDDGFVNSPKRIMRTIGASQDDLLILIGRKFIIPFDNGIVVIKHWRLHNYIRKDTYTPSPYIDQKAMLEMDEKKIYHLKNQEETIYVNDSSTSRPRVVDVDKNRIDKIRLDKISIEEESDDIPDFDLEEAWKKIRELYPKTRKNGMDIAKLRFLDLFKGISPNQYKDLAKMIARAVDLYKKDCIEQGDESFKYCPNMDKWLTESAGYWIEQAEEYERNRNAKTESDK